MSSRRRPSHTRERVIGTTSLYLDSDGRIRGCVPKNLQYEEIPTPTEDESEEYRWVVLDGDRRDPEIRLEPVDDGD